MASFLRRTGQGRADHHVAEHRLPRQQRVGLEHEADALGDAAHLAAADLDRALTGAVQARDLTPGWWTFRSPVGPTTAQNWPGSTVKVTSRIAVNGSPEAVMNRLVRCLISIFAGWMVRSGVGLASSRRALSAMPSLLWLALGNRPGKLRGAVTVRPNRRYRRVLRRGFGNIATLPA